MIYLPGESIRANIELTAYGEPTDPDGDALALTVIDPNGTIVVYVLNEDFTEIGKLSVGNFYVDLTLDLVGQYRLRSVCYISGRFSPMEETIRVRESWLP